MISRILVGLDGSKHSEIAGEYGIWLSKKLKRPVVGIHIIDIRLLEGPFIEDVAGALGFTTYSDITPKVKEALEERAKVILDTFAKECREKGGDCSIAQAYGIVYKELVNMADPEDLIIIGKKGQHPQFVNLFLGSTAENVARHSKCPVMITTDKFKEIKNVVLFFDGREKSIHAVNYLNGLYKDLGLNPVKIVSVLEEDSIEMKNHIKDLLNTHAQFEYETLFFTGYPEEVLENYLKENKENLDLAVMGAFGESRVKELILGSTTSYLMQKSPIPLLLVK